MMFRCVVICLCILLQLLGSLGATMPLDNQTIADYRAQFEMAGGRVLTPSDPDYVDFTTPWTLQCKRRPEVVFVPSTYMQAASAILLAKERGRPFVVMGGGHGWDCEGTTNGVMINTRLFDTIALDLGGATMTVGAGVLWDDIYHALRDTGYMAMGPLCPYVGVAGFTLGGGYNWFLSPFYGIGAENTLALKVLLASGEIVTADRHNQYADLAWAMLGSGGNQLGLALEFTIKLHPEPVGGYSHTYIPYTFTDDLDSVNETLGIYPVAKYKTVYRRWLQVARSLAGDPDVGSIAMNTMRDFSQGASTRQYTFFIAGVFNQPKPWAEKTVLDAAALEFPPQGRYQNYFAQWYDMEYTLFAPAWSAYPIRQFAGPSAFLTAFDDLTMDVHASFMVPATPELADTFATGTHLESFMMNEPVKNQSATSVGVAGARWKLARFFYEPPRDSTNEVEHNIHQWNIDVAEAAGDAYVGGYINYADHTLPRERYYGDTLSRLQMAKEKYDQDNFFARSDGICAGGSANECGQTNAASRGAFASWGWCVLVVLQVNYSKLLGW
jgi:hypothetical protein